MVRSVAKVLVLAVSVAGLTALFVWGDPSFTSLAFFALAYATGLILRSAIREIVRERRASESDLSGSRSGSQSFRR